jgi:hypothetical protein
MTSGAAIKQGFGLARRIRSAVWVLFFANLGLAALAALPIYRGILGFTGHSLMSRELASGLPFDWLTDFAFNSTGSFERYGEIIALLGLVTIPVNTVLAGGVLARLRQPDQSFSLGGFFRDAARYAWRLLRLMIIGLVLYWLVFRVLNEGLGNLIQARTGDWQSDRTVFWIQLGAGILLLLGLGFVNLVIDYARVKLVQEDGSSAAWAFLAALGFCLRRFPAVVTVYAVPTLAGLALLGLYWLAVPWSVVNAPDGEGAWGLYRQPLVVALLFIGQQIVMFGRYWFRVAAWAGEWSFYSGTRRGPEVAVGRAAPPSDAAEGQAAA